MPLSPGANWSVVSDISSGSTANANMEERNQLSASAEIPAKDVVIRDRSWIVTALFALLVISCLIGAYMYLFGSPSYPDYPGWQNVTRRVERKDNLRHIITTFETTDDSERVAEFYNAYLWAADLWYPRWGADYSNPIEWVYDRDFCPSELHVQRTELPTGITRVEVRLIKDCG